MDTEERLREYVNMDDIYQEYKEGKDGFSDFDMLCIEHCKDIEDILDKVDILNKEIKKLKGEE